MTGRPELLTQLADAVNQLTEPRTNTEYLEAVTIEHTTTRGRRKSKRTRQRRAHTVQLPSLLDALAAAAVPGSAEQSGPAGGFESRPSAELGPLSVLREITDQAALWSRRYHLDRPTLPKTLHGLVGATHTDSDLAELTRQAERWVTQARLATGLDPQPVTLNHPCPYCRRRHSIVVNGGLDGAKCGRCGVSWDEVTIGLLADMLTARAEEPVAVVEACWWPACTRSGPHGVHGDRRGRTWRDSCDVG